MNETAYNATKLQKLIDAVYEEQKKTEPKWVGVDLFHGTLIPAKYTQEDIDAARNRLNSYNTSTSIDEDGYPYPSTTESK